MKKSLLSAGLLFAFYLSNAQDRKLTDDFTKERTENEKKFDRYFPQNTGVNSKISDSLKSNLAGFAGNIPLFYKTEDTGANSSSNVNDLQTGAVAGINATGQNIKITVFDSGIIHNTHEQLGTTRALNKEINSYAKAAHTAQVNTVLIGNGLATGTFTDGGTYSKAKAKGVLPLGSTDNYKFQATTLGNNYQKLATLPNLNISNHSYGINVGWSYLTASAPVYPTDGWYWVANYELNTLDTYSGAYATQDESFDKIVYSNPEQIIVKSTGNYYGLKPLGAQKKYKYSSTAGKYVEFDAGDVIPDENCSKGYSCIGFGSLAKNIITVGAANQLLTADNEYTAPGDVVKAVFSSAGPRKDGAVKPDLTAVGVDMVMGTFTVASANNGYVNSFGTSFSTPIVSGIAGALTQIQRSITGDSSFLFKADEMKALLTHTANDAGRPGPDVWYGWGLVDGLKAAKVLVNKIDEDSYFERTNLQSGTPFTKELKATGTEPIKVSISWVDPAIAPFTSDIDLQSNITSRIVNDLDLRVVEVSSQTTFYPWKLDVSNPNANAAKGDNTVDNVEQIVIDNPVANGIYRIVVSNKNSLVNQDGLAASQDFAWVATGTKKITLAADVSVKEGVNIFPTKTRDIISITSPTEIGRVAVFDMTGKLILEQKKASKSQELSLSRFPNSTYIITVTNKTGTVSKKVIKE